MLRLATYNVHKCRGIDGRLRPDRILQVLRELDADAYTLQEIFENDAAWLAGELGFHQVFGGARELQGKSYGNVTLSRWPIRASQNCDISVISCEPRACLKAAIDIPGHQTISLLNVHLGTGFFERKQQVQLLLDRVLADSSDSRILIGDFNEWIPGLTSRLLAAHLESVDVRLHLRFPKTYPGIFPVLHLDHIYHDRKLALIRMHLHRTRTALVASDHLPLVADFKAAPTD